MTSDRFSQIEEGMDEKQVEKIAGKPYLKKDIGSGTWEYQYIERIYTNDRTVLLRKYLILIRNGKVTSKTMVTEDDYDPLHERNSYDLQTSQRE